MTERKDCKCECHNDGTIRHTRDDICCDLQDIQMASQPCKCGHEKWHVACSIDPHFTVGKAEITDVKKSYIEMENLRKYTGCIAFGFDPNTKSLDIHFQRASCEWDNGAGIQINKLTEDDKQALREYLENGN